MAPPHLPPRLPERQGPDPGRPGPAPNRLRPGPGPGDAGLSRAAGPAGDRKARGGHPRLGVPFQPPPPGNRRRGRGRSGLPRIPRPGLQARGGAPGAVRPDRRNARALPGGWLRAAAQLHALLLPPRRGRARTPDHDRVDPAGFPGGEAERRGTRAGSASAGQPGAV